MVPHNILVRMPNWIGDLVMATPILSDLRKAFPSAIITAMCRRPLCELLEQDEAIDELFCFAKPSNQFLRREQRDIVAKIGAGKYDLGILLTNSFSSAWWFFQGNVDRRIGYAAHFRRFLLTDPVLPSKEKMHQIDFYKKLLGPLGIPHSKTAPRLFVSAKEVEESKQLLTQRGYIRGAPLVGINPGAAYGTAKCWPPDRFRALAEDLLRDEDLFLVFFGDLTHLDLIKAICQGLPKRVINLAGVTRLRELACLIQDLDLLITNDSGPMHIGAAFGVALVALFGSTDARETGPYGQSEAVIDKRVSCSPCFKKVCPIDFRCMTRITVEEVATQARACLKRRIPK